MGSKYKPWQDKSPKNRSRVARAMIESGTGKGGPMRDRRNRRANEQDDFRALQEEEAEYDSRYKD